jgi:hypothetical protein
MHIRNANWNRPLGLLILLALGCLLGACSGSPTPAATALPATAAAAAATTVPANNPTTPAAAPTAMATSAPLPTAAATAAPTDATSANATSAVTASAAPAGTAMPDPAVSAVLAYLDARARASVTDVTALSCKTWKPKAVTEAVSFRSMNAKLVGVTCQVNGSAGSYTLVGCGGKMVTTYGTESRDWDLSAFVYQVIAEDGQWKMCGYH